MESSSRAPRGRTKREILFRVEIIIIRTGVRGEVTSPSPVHVRCLLTISIFIADVGYRSACVSLARTMEQSAPSHRERILRRNQIPRWKTIAAIRLVLAFARFRAIGRRETRVAARKQKFRTSKTMVGDLSRRPPPPPSPPNSPRILDVPCRADKSLDRDRTRRRSEMRRA